MVISSQCLGCGTGFVGMVTLETLLRETDVAEVVVFCKGEVVRAEERSPSMYSSIDLVADKVARKLRKVKERREGKRNKPQLKMSLGEMLEDPVELGPPSMEERLYGEGAPSLSPLLSAMRVCVLEPA